MAKKGDAQTVTTKPDADSLEYTRKARAAAAAAAGQPLTQYGGQEVAGPSSLTTDAATGYQKGSGLFGLGVDALSGDADAFSKFTNPYQTNVLDAIQGQASRGATLARMGIGDQAALAGAFGGDRQGVAEGVATSGIWRDAGDRMAQYTAQGFDSAQNRAYQAANMGFNSLGAQSQLGDYFRQIQQQYLDSNKAKFNEARGWDVRNLGILQSGINGAQGSAVTTPNASNPYMGAAGGALAGSQFGPYGAIGGGLIGALS